MKILPILYGFSKSIPDFLLMLSGRILNKYYSSLKLSYHTPFCLFYFCDCKITIQKSNQYESKSKIINVSQNLDGYLSFHNSVLTLVWTTDSSTPFVSTNIYPHYFFGALDDVCRSAGFGFSD